jgi:putative N-acetyltransferase (TIGR04045 family)
MKRIYEKVSPVLRAKGIYSRNSKAGCVRCGACSALRWYEEKPAQTTCHTARNPLELAKAFSIRRNVFVDEQKLFTVSDKDENDEKSIHLVAETGGTIVGTVRVYPDKNGSGRWYGGRLAVVKAHRSLKIASLLVKEAMKRARKNECGQFVAYIQEENINFFKRLGWSVISESQNLHGKPHFLMEADLSRAPDEWQE